MNLSPEECCVLNSGNGAWAFESLAADLSGSLGIGVSTEPRRFNYVLNVEDLDRTLDFGLFIPIEAIRIASDKRRLATLFREQGVPTPVTRLFDTFHELQHFLRENSRSEWCLKYPTSCGANGHRLITENSVEPANWPRPFIVQEFIRLERPEVYRIFCAGGNLFGWVVRQFPEGACLSPWVAHARGALYVRLGEAPPEAITAAKRALIATGLWDSFGCVDLIHKPTGDWLVLEVGTDGLFNHVDRDLGDPVLEAELRQRISEAFWKEAQKYRESVPEQKATNRSSPA